MPTVFYEDDDATFAESRNLTLAALRGPPTTAHVAALRAHFRSLAARHPDGVALLTSIHCDGWVPHFDDAFRDEVGRLVRDSGHGSLGSAFVLTGHGMLVSGLRAFLNGAFRIGGSDEPNRVFTDLAEAAAWLSRLPGMRARWTPTQVIAEGVAAGVARTSLRRTG